MRLILTIWILAGVFFSAAAREYEITGRIFDAQTEKRLGGAKLTVVNPVDGTIHGEGVDASYGPVPDKRNWFLFKFSTQGTDSLDLLLRINQPGYKPRVLPLKVGRGVPSRIEFNEPIWME